MNANPIAIGTKVRFAEKARDGIFKQVFGTIVSADQEHDGTWLYVVEGDSIQLLKELIRNHVKAGYRIDEAINEAENIFDFCETSEGLYAIDEVEAHEIVTL